MDRPWPVSFRLVSFKNLCHSRSAAHTTVVDALNATAEVLVTNVFQSFASPNVVELRNAPTLELWIAAPPPVGAWPRGQLEPTLVTEGPRTETDGPCTTEYP